MVGILVLIFVFVFYICTAWFINDFYYHYKIPRVVVDVDIVADVVALLLVWKTNILKWKRKHKIKEEKSLSNGINKYTIYWTKFC